jgi:hypothetical protein
VNTPTVRAAMRTDRAPRVQRAFASAGGRVFTVGRCTRTSRGADDTFWQDCWPIFLDGKQVGQLWRSAAYGPELPWMATTRELAWSGPLPPIGLGFDGPASATVGKALASFARIADEVLDWRAGKRVRSVYSKVGYYQREVAP